MYSVSGTSHRIACLDPEAETLLPKEKQQGVMTKRPQMISRCWFQNSVHLMPIAHNSHRKQTVAWFGPCIHISFMHMRSWSPQRIAIAKMWPLRVFRQHTGLPDLGLFSTGSARVWPWSQNSMHIVLWSQNSMQIVANLRNDPRDQVLISWQITHLFMLFQNKQDARMS